METGGESLTKGGIKIFDSVDYNGHESLIIDNLAREIMQAVLDWYSPPLEGIVCFELRPFNKIPNSLTKSFKNGRTFTISKGRILLLLVGPPFEKLQKKLKELSLTKSTL